MDSEEITQIRVGQMMVGIIGLKGALDEMGPFLGQSKDGEIAEALLSRLSKKNYIPPKAKDDYGQALVREFRKHLGQDSLANDEEQGLVIRLLGQGCAGCQAFNRSIMEILSELNLAADFEHVTDMKEIARYGILQSPALLINGKLAAVGGIPSKAQLSEWFLKNSVKKKDHDKPKPF